MEIIFLTEILFLYLNLCSILKNVKTLFGKRFQIYPSKMRVITKDSKIDAYVVNNHEVKAYVETRETNYL